MERLLINAKGWNNNTTDLKGLSYTQGHLHIDFLFSFGLVKKISTKIVSLAFAKEYLRVDFSKNLSIQRVCFFRFKESVIIIDFMLHVSTRV